MAALVTSLSTSRTIIGFRNGGKVLRNIAVQVCRAVVVQCSAAACAELLYITETQSHANL